MIEQIKKIIDGKNSKSFHKILSKYPDIVDWINCETLCYSPRSLNEKLHILLKSPPEIKPCGKFPVFSSFEKGYRLYCGSRSVCKCSADDHSKKMFDYNQNLSTSEKKHIQEKIKKTNLKKYGVENVAQNNKIKQKLKQTNQERYGANSPLESKIIQNKIQNANLKKYGVKYPFQSKEIQDKSHNTAVKRYGIDYMLIARTAFLEKNQNKNPFVVYQEKIKNSLMRKYGVDHPLKDTDILKKSQDTLSNNHGVTNPSQLHISQESYQILEDFEKFKSLCKKHSLKDLTTLLNVSESIIWNRHDRYNLDFYSKKSRSQYEEEIANWLDQNDISYIRNYKINSKTVDFLIDQNFAIEFNGLYTHSENSNYGKKLKIDSKYHYSKYIDCRAQNIKLFTVFEDEWNQRKSIIKNRILVITNKATKGISARKCAITSIDSLTAINFLNQYHLQGGIPSSIYLGAFYENQLIAVMTFKVNKNSYELNRYASDFQIHPGLFSKMLSYFEKNYDYDFVYSFSDNRWGWGEVYDSNGFSVDSYVKPDYFVTNYKIREHKFNWRKSRIQSRFNIDITNKTELELIHELKWDRIWDCGKIKWIKSKK